MKPRMNSLTCTGVAAVLAFVLPGESAQASPFEVEAASLPLVAFEALASRFPEVSPGDVEVESPVYFNCDARPNIAGLSGIEHSTLNCMATVNIDVSATDVAYRFVDAKGNCRVLDPPDTATVHVSPDGSSRVHFHPKNVHESDFVACDDEFIGHVAVMDQRIPGAPEAFSVDAQRVLELAFTAAGETHAHVQDEQIVFGDGSGFSVTCEAASKSGDLAPANTAIERCSARVKLANESVRLDYRYLMDDKCMIGKASDWITVEIDQDGLIDTRATENSGAGRARAVACDQAFFDSPLPMITSPARGG